MRKIIGGGELRERLLAEANRTKGYSSDMSDHLRTAGNWARNYVVSHLITSVILAVGVGGSVTSGLTAALDAPAWAIAAITVSAVALIVAVFTLTKLRHVLPDQPVRADAKQWGAVRRLKLSEAACLWVGIEPHDPIVNQRVRARLHRLREAVEDGELVRRRSQLAQALDDAIQADGSGVTVSDRDEVETIELARYADSTGQPRPEFLRNVEVVVHNDGEHQQRSSASQ